MAVTKRQITSAEKLADYFEKKGDLHDCVVELLQWQPSAKFIEIKLLDVNANFLGLSEYEGLTPCVMKLKGVSDVSFSISSPDEKLRVYEVQLSALEGRASLKMLFSPSGSMELSFREVDFFELN
jgi:hypothetical protein